MRYHVLLLFMIVTACADGGSNASRLDSDGCLQVREFNLPSIYPTQSYLYQPGPDGVVMHLYIPSGVVRPIRSWLIEPGEPPKPIASPKSVRSPPRTIWGASAFDHKITRLLFEERAKALWSHGEYTLRSEFAIDRPASTEFIAMENVVFLNDDQRLIFFDPSHLGCHQIRSDPRKFTLSFSERNE